MEQKPARFMAPAGPGQGASAPQAAPIEGDTLQARIVFALRGVYDPEIPVNIYDLGLIYGIDCGEDGHVRIRMTLTAPACPVAGAIPQWVEEAVLRVPGVKTVTAELVWDPPWTQERMSDEARLALGLM